jgi:hypothetical protein
VIVAAWATFLFFGFGLMSGGKAMSFVAVAVGALCGRERRFSDP